jgi:hypothetical protein
MFVDSGRLLDSVDSNAQTDLARPVQEVVLDLRPNCIRTPNLKGDSIPHATNQFLGRVRWRRTGNSFPGFTLQGTPTPKVPSKNYLALSLDSFLAEIMFCFQAADQEKQSVFFCEREAVAAHFACCHIRRGWQKSLRLMPTRFLCFSEFTPICQQLVSGIWERRTVAIASVI